MVLNRCYSFEEHGALEHILGVDMRRNGHDLKLFDADNNTIRLV